VSEAERVEPSTQEQPYAEVERVDEDTLAMSYGPLWVLPFVGVGLALLFGFYFPDAISDFYMNTVFPFGVTFWLGTFFSYGWDLQRLWIQELPRKWAPWVVGAAVVLVVLMLGGPQAIIDDPWLVGMVVFPGVRMWMRYRQRQVVKQA
jgi:hypothetical protein